MFKSILIMKRKAADFLPGCSIETFFNELNANNINSNNKKVQLKTNVHLVEFDALEQPIPELNKATDIPCIYVVINKYEALLNIKPADEIKKIYPHAYIVLIIDNEKRTDEQRMDSKNRLAKGINPAYDHSTYQPDVTHVLDVENKDEIKKMQDDVARSSVLAKLQEYVKKKKREDGDYKSAFFCIPFISRESRAYNRKLNILLAERLIKDIQNRPLNPIEEIFKQDFTITREVSRPEENPQIAGSDDEFIKYNRGINSIELKNILRMINPKWESTYEKNHPILNCFMF